MDVDRNRMHDLNTRSPRWRRRLWIILAGVILALPLVDHIVGLDPSEPLYEKRALLERPGSPGNLKECLNFPERFDAWYCDHFGWRRALVRLHGGLVYTGWSRHGSVLVGRDRWLFYRGDDGRSCVEDHTGRVELSETIARRGWETLTRRQQILAAHGIRYIYAVAPDKASIYPGQYPARLRRVKARTRLDQFLDWRPAGNHVNILDLRHILREARAKAQVYHSTDSHWNALGALAAQEAIVQAFDSGIEPLVQDDFTVKERRCSKRDLLTMLSLNVWYASTEPVLVPKPKGRAHPWVGRIETTQPHVFEGTGALNVLLFRDSFADNLITFLVPHVAKLTCVAGNPSVESLQHWIEEAHPDVVIDLHVERSLPLLFTPHDIERPVEQVQTEPLK
jgi:alginate O-acetyltransferase complex protein AlgJ